MISGQLRAWECALKDLPDQQIFVREGMTL